MRDDNKQLNKSNRINNKVARTNEKNKKASARTDEKQKQKANREAFIQEKINQHDANREQAKQNFNNKKNQIALKKSATEQLKIDRENERVIKNHNRLNKISGTKNRSNISKYINTKKTFSVARFKNNNFTGLKKANGIGPSSKKHHEKNNVISLKHNFKNWGGSGFSKSYGKEYNRDLFHALRNKYIFENEDKLTPDEYELINDFEKMMGCSPEQLKIIMEKNVGNDLSNVIMGLSALNAEETFYDLSDFLHEYQEKVCKPRKHYDEINIKINQLTTTARNLKEQLIVKVVDYAAEHQFDYQGKLLNIRKELKKERDKLTPSSSRIQELTKEREEIKDKRKKAINNLKQQSVKNLDAVNKHKESLNVEMLNDEYKALHDKLQNTYKELNDLKDEKKDFQNKKENYDIVKNFNKKNVPKSLEQIVVIPEWQYSELEKVVGVEGARVIFKAELADFMRDMENKFGYKPGHLSLHLDEGHICSETGVFSRNVHAHLLYYNYDFKNNVIPSLEVDRKYKRNNTLEQHETKNKESLAFRKYGYGIAGRYESFEQAGDMLAERFNQYGFVRGLKNKYNPEKNKPKRNDEFVIEQVGRIKKAKEKLKSMSEVITAENELFKTKKNDFEIQKTTQEEKQKIFLENVEEDIQISFYLFNETFDDYKAKIKSPKPTPYERVSEKVEDITELLERYKIFLSDEVINKYIYDFNVLVDHVNEFAEKHKVKPDRDISSSIESLQEKIAAAKETLEADTPEQNTGRGIKHKI